MIGKIPKPQIIFDPIVQTEHRNKSAAYIGTLEDIYEAQALASVHKAIHPNQIVHFQSTTRSPAKKFGAIQSILTCPDPFYPNGPTNYLYNFDPTAYDSVTLVTGAKSHELIRKIKQAICANAEVII
ncbi:MAG: TRSP domain-containing protein [Flavobacteriales bacterium]|nr:TRSP domain-containing protein [Flavobacteriales bacterium]